MVMLRGVAEAVVAAGFDPGSCPRAGNEGLRNKRVSVLQNKFLVGATPHEKDGGQNGSVV